MKITYAPMVGEKECENFYINQFLEPLKDEFDDSYNFIIARTNNSDENRVFHDTIIDGKKNILLLKSDERGILPPFLEKLHKVFRFYNHKSLYDDNKIYCLPCGYSCDYDYPFNNFSFCNKITQSPSCHKNIKKRI